MRTNKIVEFLSVLLVGVLVAITAMLAVMHLEGRALEFAVVGILALIILSWHLLRKYFGRYE